MSKPPRENHRPLVIKSIKQPATEGFNDSDEWSTSGVAYVANMNYEIRSVAEDIRSKLLELQNQRDPAVKDLIHLTNAVTEFASEQLFAFGRLMEGYGVADAKESPLEEIHRSGQDKSILAGLTERATSTAPPDHPEREHD